MDDLIDIFGGSQPQITNIFSQFSNSLFGQLLNNQKMLFSPINIQMALLMTYMGANNETKKEIKNTLGLSNFQDNQIHSEMQQVQNRLNQQSNNLQIKTANKLFCDHSIQLLSNFQSQLKTYYNSQIDQIDFNNSYQAVKTINNWVQNETENKIQNLLEQVSPDQKLVLISAIYFKCLWKNQFQQNLTKKQSPFNANLPYNQKVDLMYQEDKFKYYKSTEYEILQMDYKDTRFSMVFILPNISLDFFKFQTQFHQNSLMDSVLLQITNQTYRKVQVHIPKFKLTSHISLQDTLQNLGMIEAFDPIYADFSQMEQTDQLYISDVIHKAFIEVNEEGSEAAAVTVVEILNLKCLPEKEEEIPIFKADRSFIYCIKDNIQQNLLFVGNYQGLE